MNQAPGHHHHRQPASHHQRHRNRLAFNAAKIAQELAIEFRNRHGEKGALTS
jgi:hypothetical protein